MESDTATIVVANDQPWFGDQRLGALTAYVDGEPVGRVVPRREV
jgi:hypothetical protein